MCLIVSRPAEAIFPIEQLEVAHFSNPHGVGFMWPGRSRLQTEKIASPENFNQVGDLYESVLKRSAGKPLAIHFRWATHGLKDMENTHPYKVLDKKKSGMDLYMMHNGIIPRVGTYDSDFSDTWHYVHDHLLGVLTDYPDIIWAEWFQDEIGKAIGANNKLLFMDNEGKQAFINYKQGHLAQDTGCWLSNAGSISGARLSRNKNTPSHLKSISTPTLKKPLVWRSMKGAVTVNKLSAMQGEIILTISATGAYQLIWTITNEHLKGYLTVSKGDRERRYNYVKAHAEALEDAKLIQNTIVPGDYKDDSGVVKYAMSYHTLSEEGLEILSQLEDGSLKVESSIKDVCALLDPKSNGTPINLGPDIQDALGKEEKKIPAFPKTFTQKVESTRRQRRKIRLKVALPKATTASAYTYGRDDWDDDEFTYESTVPWYTSKNSLNKFIAEGASFQMSDEVAIELTLLDLSHLLTKYPYKVASWLQDYILKI